MFLSCTGLLITVKDTGNYASKQTSFRRYHSLRLLVSLRTGLDEACEQRRPEGGLHTSGVGGYLKVGG